MILVKKNIKNFVISICLVIVAIVYTFLVKTIDVQQIGPNNSSVGFAKINSSFANVIGSNMTIYKITEILGLIALLVAGLYAFKGIIQLIKKKNIFKVSPEILVVGGLYVVVIMIYVFFEKFIVNYRPVLIDNVLEASYPSSHTMLAICICVSSIMINKYLFKDKNVIKYFNMLDILLLITIVSGRILSGVHWLSDIIGGVIISLALLMIFKSVLDLIKYKENSGK